MFIEIKKKHQLLSRQQCSSLLHLVFSNGHKTDGICKVTAAEIKFIKISSGSKHFYIIYINNILFYYCEFFFVIQNIFLVGSEKSEINFGHTFINNKQTIFYFRLEQESMHINQKSLILSFDIFVNAYKLMTKKRQLQFITNYASCQHFFFLN
jgi:hypothetical protein